jgi:outer membrane biogenesis lipoprotein LolB
MKRNVSWILMSVVLFLAGCSSPPAFTVDKQVWTGEATGNQQLIVSISFTQTGETVEGLLKLTQQDKTLEQRLKGTLENTVLSLDSDPVGDSIRGVFNEADKTFVGVLSLLIESEADDFVLRLRPQGQ